MNIKVPRTVLAIWAVIYPYLMLSGWWSSWRPMCWGIGYVSTTCPQAPPQGIFVVLFHPVGIMVGVLFYGLTSLALLKKDRRAESKNTAARFSQGETEKEVAFAEEWECEVCGAIVDVKATVCPACGTQFED